MPFGLVCAPAIFTQMMRKLLHGISHVDNSIDDILVYTPTWEDHVVVLQTIFHRLEDANLTAKPSKCMLGFPSIDFLGHKVGEGKVKPITSTLEKILNVERPSTKTQVRSFLGLTGYYRAFIPHYAALAAPLTDLTRKNQPNKVVWGDAQEKAFKSLKQMVSTPPILRLPNFQKPFVLRTDASDTGLGAILLQEDDGELFPIGYASLKLSDRQRKYSVIERECLAVVWGIKKYKYLYGTHFTLQTDHQPLSYLDKAQFVNA